MSNLKYKHTAYTSAQWASLNPVIVENEIVIESDTKRTKIGNGISTYNELEYADANSVGNSLGSIKPTDAAPTPARNGNYTFSIGGNKPAWLTAEAGVTTVKAGDGVAVVYTAPSGYSYTHVDTGSAYESRLNGFFVKENDFPLEGVYSTGDLFVTSDNWRSKELKISAGDTLKIRAYSDSPARVAVFKNLNGDIILSVIANDVSVVSAQEFEIIAPVNSFSVVISTFYANVSDSYYQILSAIDKYSDQIIGGKKTFSTSPSVPIPILDADATPRSYVNNMVGKSYAQYNDFVTNGVYINGVWSVSSSWKSKTIDITEGKTIDYVLHSTNNAALITFLNSSNAIISSIMSAAVGIDVVQAATIIVPVNAVKAVITTHLDYVASSNYKVLVSNTDIFVRKTGTAKIYIVDKTKTLDAANNIYPTIAGALAVATGIDTIKLFGSESSPYNEFHLTLPDGITIIGIGTPWIKGEQLASETVDNILNLSTLEAYNGFTLENLLITCKNARYPIHADFSNGNTIKNVRNCRFIHYGNKEAYDYQVANSGNPTGIVRGMSAWGGGTKSGDKVYIDGCYFESPMRAFSTHNNTNFNLTNGASIVKVINSKMISHGIDRDGSNLSFLVPIHVQSLTSNANDRVIFENCEANGYINFESAPTQNVYLDILGLKQIWNNAGGGLGIYDDWNSLNVNWYPFVKGEIRAFKNMNIAALTRGKAVKRSGVGIDLFTSSDNINDFFGVLMQDATPGKSADVKMSGYIPIKYLNGNNTIANGSDISVDATGAFVANSTFIVMKAEDNSNVKIR